MLENVFRRGGLTGPKHHSQTHALAQPVIGHRYRRDALNGVMGRGQRFDLSRINVAATANDHIFLATCDAQISVLVDPAEIAGHTPAVPIKGLFRGRLIVEIAEHQACATTADLADLMRWYSAVRIISIEDPDFVAGAGFPAAFDDQLRVIVG